MRKVFKTFTAQSMTISHVTKTNPYLRKAESMGSFSSLRFVESSG